MSRLIRSKTVVSLCIVGLFLFVATLASSAASSGSGPTLPVGKDPTMYQSNPGAPRAASAPGGSNAAKAPVAPVAGPGAPPRGVIDSSQAPLPGSLYQIQNQWQDVIGGQWLHVYAGSMYSDTEQGVLITMTNTLDWSQASAPTVVTGPRTGAFTIVSANGAILTIRATGGQVYTFNAATARFMT